MSGQPTTNNTKGAIESEWQKPRLQVATPILISPEDATGSSIKIPAPPSPLFFDSTATPANREGRCATTIPRAVSLLPSAATPASGITQAVLTCVCVMSGRCPLPCSPSSLPPIGLPVTRRRRHVMRPQYRLQQSEPAGALLTQDACSIPQDPEQSPFRELQAEMGMRGDVRAHQLFCLCMVSAGEHSSSSMPIAPALPGRMLHTSIISHHLH